MQIQLAEQTSQEDMQHMADSWISVRNKHIVEICNAPAASIIKGGNQ